jgi:hypothetical protein
VALKKKQIDNQKSKDKLKDELKVAKDELKVGKDELKIFMKSDSIILNISNRLSNSTSPNGSFGSNGSDYTNVSIDSNKSMS